MQISTLEAALDAPASLGPDAQSPQCAIARKANDEASDIYNRYQRLLYTVSIVVVVTVVVGLVLVLVGGDKTAAAIAAFMASAVGGAGLKFVLSQRKQAEIAAKRAQALAIKYCGTPST